MILDYYKSKECVGNGFARIRQNSVNPHQRIHQHSSISTNRCDKRDQIWHTCIQTRLRVCLICSETRAWVYSGCNPTVLVKKTLLWQKTRLNVMPPYWCQRHLAISVHVGFRHKLWDSGIGSSPPRRSCPKTASQGVFFGNIGGV